MATEATFTVGSGEFPLGSVFKQLPGVTVELEPRIPAPGVVVPYFWVRGVTTDDVEEAFRDHPGVKDIRLVDSVEDEYLLRVEWESEHAGILVTLSEVNLIAITATGTHDQWTFEIRGEDQNDIAEFQTLCREREIPVTLTAMHALTPVQSRVESGLTDAQKEVMLLAYDRGYFNSPRDVTMEELGDELGISQQAVGSRLRRGIKSVLRGTLSVLQSD